MNGRQLLQMGQHALSGEDAALEAWILFSEAFDMTRSDFLLHEKEEVDPEKEHLYLEMLQQRQTGKPVAYIIGNWEFMGLPFKVSPDVLIPRPDTETLVEAVLEWAAAERNSQKIRVLDLCTGSGCIAVSLAHMLPSSQVEASDISPQALAIAQTNAELNQVSVTFHQGDLWAALPAGRQYDVITSNPPYIDWRQMKELEPDVIDFEPRLALDGGEDGLLFYRRLADQACEFLLQGGRVYWEIGYDQGDAVTKIVQNRGLRVLEVRKDLAGHDRVVIAEKE